MAPDLSIRPYLPPGIRYQVQLNKLTVVCACITTRKKRSAEWWAGATIGALPPSGTLGNYPCKCPGIKTLLGVRIFL